MKIKHFVQIVIIITMSLKSLGEVNATNQSPDRLIYSDIELKLSTGWAFPSPLQMYYYQNGIDYPFKMLSTANYRGFIASWEIRDDRLILKKIDVDGKEFTPEHFHVKSKNIGSNKGEAVFADWFSGVIECSVRKEDDFNFITSYFFQIREGIIVDKEVVAEGLGNSDYFKKLKDHKLSKMYDNYMGFYYRMADDNVIHNEEKGRLNLSRTKHSPLLRYYGQHAIDFKFNWENLQKSGYPNCTWIIQDNTIYLQDIILRYGNRLDTVYTHKVDLKEEFGDKCQANKVRADWINGVLLLKFGDLVKEEVFSGYEREVFNVDEFLFIRVKSGEVIEQYSICSDFDFENLPEDIEPKLKKMISEY